jgi:perosamine synthetase
VIPYGRHDVNEDDIVAVVKVLRGDWLTTGPAVDQFEADLQEETGGVPVVAVSSGTAALHTAYVAAGIGPGDEVITPPITFVATQAAAVHVGAIPVFADVEADTANLDPSAVEAMITPRTAAIVAVDYAGHPAEMDALRMISDRHNLILIEDAAHSLGSVYKGRPVGSLADVTVFSFFATKNIATGEGGAVATKDPAILERARRFSRQGLIRDPSRQITPDEGPWHQEVHEFGLNYRLPDILAALGSSQLVRLPEFGDARRRIKAMYDEAFLNFDDLLIPAQRSYCEPIWHLYPLRVPVSRRKEMYEGLRDAGVGVQVNYMPAYRHPAFRGRLDGSADCPNAENFYAQELSLPIWPALPEPSVRRVIEVVCGLLAR